jgi:hypothetical protein
MEGVVGLDIAFICLVIKLKHNKSSNMTDSQLILLLNAR